MNFKKLFQGSKKETKKIRFTNGKDYEIDQKKERSIGRNIVKDKVESYLKETNKKKKR